MTNARSTVPRLDAAAIVAIQAEANRDPVRRLVHRYDAWPLDFITREQAIKELVAAGVVAETVASQTNDGWIVGAWNALEAARLIVKDAAKADERTDQAARKDSMPTNDNISARAAALTKERRDEMTAELVQVCLDAGDTADRVHEHEQHARAQSNAGFLGFVESMIPAKREQIGSNLRQREAAKRKEIEQTTDADRRQAADELAVMYGSSQYASKHAERTDEAAHAHAVEMRARSIARRRVHREDLDARTIAGLDKPKISPARTDATCAPDDPFDPLRNGVGVYASPTPGRRKGG